MAPAGATTTTCCSGELDSERTIFMSGDKQSLTKIQSLLASCPRATDRVPVIFNGSPPRIVGYAASYAEADACLIGSRLSATYLSRGMVDMPDGSAVECIISHGR